MTDRDDRERWRYQATSSSAGHGGPSRRASRNATPDCLAARVLVVSTPAVCCDHRQYEAPALADQFLVSVRIAVADLFGHPTKVVLDRPTGCVLEVHEERPVLRVEHVPRVRLAVQQLLGGAPVDDRLPQIAQRVGEQRPVRIGEIGSDVAARNVLLHSRDTIHEVRRRDIDLPQAGMKRSSACA